MTSVNPPLPSGYSPAPLGKLASVVTYLEMSARPPSRAAPAIDSSLQLQHWDAPDLDEYRALFRLVGQDWMWFSRLVMADDELAAIVSNPLVEIYAPSDGRRQLGLLELDFRVGGQCELAFFGLMKEEIGKGVGRVLMNFAIDRAWSRPIRRFWVHTCNFDHPGALAFYRRSGFRPYAFMIDIADDPRLTGHMPRSAAPHIPLLDTPSPRRSDSGGNA